MVVNNITRGKDCAEQQDAAIELDQLGDRVLVLAFFSCCSKLFEMNDPRFSSLSLWSQVSGEPRPDTYEPS